MNAEAERDPALARPRRRWCRIAWRAALAALILAGAGAWIGRDWVLREAAEAWIVSDAPQPADAVAILGGGIQDRPFAAADYYRRGLVKTILISNTGATPIEKLGVWPSHVVYTRDALLKLGVPDSAIEPFGHDLLNTHEEAEALKTWAVAHGAHRLIVPTELFTTRRLRWTLERVMPPGTVVMVPALAPSGYRADNWWRSESGVASFLNEIIKYAFYLWTY